MFFIRICAGIDGIDGIGYLCMVRTNTQLSVEHTFMFYASWMHGLLYACSAGPTLHAVGHTEIEQFPQSTASLRGHCFDCIGLLYGIRLKAGAPPGRDGCGVSRIKHVRLESSFVPGTEAPQHSLAGNPNQTQQTRCCDGGPAGRGGWDGAGISYQMKSLSRYRPCRPSTSRGRRCHWPDGARQ